MQTGALLLSICAGVVLPSLAHAQADLEAYIAGIRSSGMSEYAAGDLRSVAYPLAGASRLRVQRTGTRVTSWGYEPTMCFLPGADEKSRALRQKIQAKAETWMTYLKKHADADGSGFVTTEEGRALRRKIERGLMAVDLGATFAAEDLARAMNDDPKQVVGDLAAYGRIREAAVRDEMDGMPPLP